MKNVERWKENKVRERKVSKKKSVTFTKKENDYAIMECIKMIKITPLLCKSEEE